MLWAGAINPALGVAASDGGTPVPEVAMPGAALTVPDKSGEIKLLERIRLVPNTFVLPPPPAEVAARAESPHNGVARKPCSRPVASY